MIIIIIFITVLVLLVLHIKFNHSLVIIISVNQGLLPVGLWQYQLYTSNPLWDGKVVVLLNHLVVMFLVSHGFTETMVTLPLLTILS
uniref:Uncharacterized protein n=1 Tax=Amphimedon queenslandica TaxID=400682 RepID=A0A1X7T0Z7_AMPQE